MNNVSNEEAVIELLTLNCEIDEDGTKVYYNKEGKLHRIHGPAVINTAGTQIWYKEGKTHREDGPAIEWEDGVNWYYIDGERIFKN